MEDTRKDTMRLMRLVCVVCKRRKAIGIMNTLKRMWQFNYKFYASEFN